MSPACKSDSLTAAPFPSCVDELLLILLPTAPYTYWTNPLQSNPLFGLVPPDEYLTPINDLAADITLEVSTEAGPE